MGQDFSSIKPSMYDATGIIVELEGSGQAGQVV